MNDKKDKNKNLLADEKRLTKFGTFIRELSLDELPQLFNVIIGDMGIIGPRPFPVDYFKYYSTYQKQRHLVKPGITGIAQVKGRNQISYQHRIRWDVFYVKNVSLKLDLKILYLTFFKNHKKRCHLYC